MVDYAPFDAAGHLKPIGTPSPGHGIVSRPPRVPVSGAVSRATTCLQ